MTTFSLIFLVNRNFLLMAFVNDFVGIRGLPRKKKSVTPMELCQKFRNWEKSGNFEECELGTLEHGGNYKKFYQFSSKKEQIIW